MIPPRPEPERRIIPVIINPNAHSARARFRMEDVRALNPCMELFETTAAGDACRIAERLARAGATLVVAVGGDGTVNEVVNGISRAGATDRTALGILPAGTMNVFAAELGLPAARLDECWRIIEHGHRRRLDLWRIADTRFIQLAGAGMDAAIIRETTWELKRKFGPLSYVIAGLRMLFQEAPPMTVHADGQPPVTGTVVLMGNGRRYGGPFRLFPDALPADGLLDVIIMRRHGLREFLAVAKGLISGRYGVGREVSYFQTAGLRIEAATMLPFEADGELTGSSCSIEVRRDGSLEVMAPE